jgi:hypothetical protein
VCSWSDTHQGDTYEQLFVYDFTLDKGWETLVTVWNNEAYVCSALGYLDPSFALLQGHLGAAHFEDTSDGGAPDLVMEVYQKKTRWSKEVERHVRRACKAVDYVIDAAKLFGPPGKETLVFHYEARGFKPTPDTKRILRGL